MEKLNPLEWRFARGQRLCGALRSPGNHSNPAHSHGRRPDGRHRFRRLNARSRRIVSDRANRPSRLGIRRSTCGGNPRGRVSEHSPARGPIESAPVGQVPTCPKSSRSDTFHHLSALTGFVPAIGRNLSLGESRVLPTRRWSQPHQIFSVLLST